MAGEEDASSGRDPGALADGAAETLSRLLGLVEAGEVTAPPGLVARLEGAQEALRRLAEVEGTSPRGEPPPGPEGEGPDLRLH